MAFFDGFFDWLSDAYDEYESAKRTSSQRRYSDPDSSGYRYSSRSDRSRQSHSEDDLERYEGLYRKVREHSADSDGQRALQKYGRRIGSEYDPYGDGYERPHGLDPRKRREARMQERERLSGVHRPGHIYDDIADRLDDDSDDVYLEPTFGLGRNKANQRIESEPPEPRRSHRVPQQYDYEYFDGLDPLTRPGRGRRPMPDNRYDDPYYDRYPRDRRRDYDRVIERRPVKKKMSIGVRFLIIGLAAVFVVLWVITLGSVTTKPRQPVEEVQEVDYSGSMINGEYVPNTPDALYKQQAEQIVDAMTIEEKVGQLIIAASDGHDDAFYSLVSATDAAGVILRPIDIAGRSSDGLKSFIRNLRREGGSDLLVMVEEEGGATVTISSSSIFREDGFRSAQAMYVSGGFDLIASDAAEKSRFLREYDINVNLAPVCDVVTSTNGFMYSRSFGHGAEDTSRYVSTVTENMKKNGMGCVLKYFPGYGNSTGDTLNGLVVINTVETVLRARDLEPFRAGIEAGADAVMMSHALVTELDNTAPASLSPTVIGILRNDLDFDGVIISEALDDEGLFEYTGGEDVSVKALDAGIDMLLAPPDAVAARSAIIEAVSNGTLSQERLTEAARRVVRWKLSLGLYETDG